MGSLDAPLQLLVANLDSSDYLGRIAIGRIFNGRVKIGDEIAICTPTSEARKAKVTKLYSFDGLKRIDIDNAAAGDIVCLAGIADITIGETVTEVERQMPVQMIAVDEPTVSMIFGVNTSPMAGREGQYVTSRQVRDRLERELIGNVSIRLENTDSPETVKVVGRGELQLSILIEMMRREGFELQVSRPEIVTKEVNGQRVEPVEDLVIDVPGGLSGRRHRHGRRPQRHDDEDGEPRQRPRAHGVPDTRARADRVPVAVSDRHPRHRHHEPPVCGMGALARRHPGAGRGSAGCRPHGRATAYALSNLQERGEIFIEAATTVYEGMIIGENARPSDMDVNVTKEKKQTNMRASSADEAIRLIPPAFWDSNRRSSSSTTMNSWKSRPKAFGCGSGSWPRTSGRSGQTKVVSGLTSDRFYRLSDDILDQIFLQSASRLLIRYGRLSRQGPFFGALRPLAGFMTR